ncbi:MAG: signal peptidase I [Tepidisphaeraceae bacterium]
MISLSILIAFTILWLLLSAWALSTSARAAGSPRGSFRRGVAVVALLFVVECISEGIGIAAPSTSPRAAAVSGLVRLALLWIVVFLVFRSGFKLNAKRTLAPFGVYLGLGVASLALAVFVIKPYLIEAFVLPTQSMAPTIESGNRFVVNKLVQPRRLDLVTYWSDDSPPAVYCKRLIGLPGERIRFEGGGVFVNDQPITLPPVLAGRCHASPAPVPPSKARYRDGESISLGPNEYFLIGDNVDRSADSRLAGPTHASALVGVVDFVYWPPSKIRLMR